MYRLRHFRNTDPPQLVEIWRSQPPQRGLLQPVTTQLLELSVFSKAYFDPQGLIVATQDDLPVGFVHAGFGPNESGCALDTGLGVTQLLLVRSGYEAPNLADQLLEASEEYLRSRGATVIYGGGVNPLNPFYLGLYGGSEIPGVLDSSTALREACQRRGYGESAQVLALQCELSRFRPVLSRKVRQVRRLIQFEEIYDPPVESWWDASLWGGEQRIRFALLDKSDQHTIASASFWDIQPLSSCWGICTAGLYDIYVEPKWRREGLATYLLGEAFRQLRSRGVMAVEAQTMVTNEAAISFYRHLGFSEVDRGVVFRK